MITHYDVLGVPRDATADQVKAAYRASARMTHPDAGADNSKLFLLVKAAYDVLSSPERRAAYDAELASAHRPPAADEPGPARPPAGSAAAAAEPAPGPAAGAPAAGPAWMGEPTPQERRRAETRERVRAKAQQRAQWREQWRAEYRKQPFRPVSWVWVLEWSLLAAWAGYVAGAGRVWPGLGPLAVAAALVTCFVLALRPVFHRRARRRAPSSREQWWTLLWLCAPVFAVAAAPRPTGAAVAAVVGALTTAGYVVWAGWMVDSGKDVYAGVDDPSRPVPE